MYIENTDKIQTTPDLINDSDFEQNLSKIEEVVEDGESPYFFIGDSDVDEDFQVEEYIPEPEPEKEEDPQTLYNIDYDYILTDEDLARCAEQMAELDMKIEGLNNALQNLTYQKKAFTEQKEKAETDRIEISHKVREGKEVHSVSATREDDYGLNEIRYYFKGEVVKRAKLFFEKESNNLFNPENLKPEIKPELNLDSDPFTEENMEESPSPETENKEESTIQLSEKDLGKTSQEFWFDWFLNFEGMPLTLGMTKKRLKNIKKQVLESDWFGSLIEDITIPYEDYELEKPKQIYFDEYYEKCHRIMVEQGILESK